MTNNSKEIINNNLRQKLFIFLASGYASDIFYQKNMFNIILSDKNFFSPNYQEILDELIFDYHTKKQFYGKI